MICRYKDAYKKHPMSIYRCHVLTKMKFCENSRVSRTERVQTLPIYIETISRPTSASHVLAFFRDLATLCTA